MCGLKLETSLRTGGRGGVTPYVGVWIETPMDLIVIVDSIVTPYVGVWIETRFMLSRIWIEMVTPYVGVWIETLKKKLCVTIISHTLRGCVD